MTEGVARDRRRREAIVMLTLFGVTAALGTRFLDWPLNRDITWYATIARELLVGERQLCLQLWDITSLPRFS